MAKALLRAPAASLQDEAGDRLRLTVSRELASIYTDVLAEPVPAELRLLIEALEDRYKARPFRPEPTEEAGRGASSTQPADADHHEDCEQGSG